jgi:hypothetical protein
MPSKIEEIFDLHEVTVGEAAGAALFGAFQPHTRSIWGVGLNVLDEREEWDLLSLECYYHTAAGLDYNGRMLYLFACQAPGGVIHQLPQNNVCQYLGQRVALLYPQYLTRGFFVHTGGPLVAGDRLAVTALYRMVRHER